MGCLGNLLWFIFGGAISALQLVRGRMSLVHYCCRYSHRYAVL